jgi:hypothetical protein
MFSAFLPLAKGVPRPPCCDPGEIKRVPCPIPEKGRDFPH